MQFLQNDYSKLDQPAILAVIFHPRQESARPAADITDFTVTTGDGNRIGCRFHLCDPEAPHILFFHGNGETVSDYDDVGAHYTGLALNFLAIGYRGYGASTGKPTVAAMMEDACKAFEQIREWKVANRRPGPMMVMGRSLGSAAALEVAGHFQDAVSGLIIESGFATTTPLLLTLGIDPGKFDFAERDGFNNLAKIGRITKPTLILHGQNDELIPVSNGGSLQSQCAARNKELQIVPGATHNTVMACGGSMYFETILRFTDKATGRRGQRKRRYREKK